MTSTWSDITHICRSAADAVNAQMSNPMLYLESFSLHESMSATELMDAKMDQCHGFELLHNMNVQDLFSLPTTQFSWEQVVGFFVFLLQNEVAFFSGSSILESTHRCPLVWKEIYEQLSQRQGLQERVILMNCKVFLRTMSLAMSAILTADIYEDEDFCPAFKSYLHDSEESTADLIFQLKALKEEIVESSIPIEIKRIIEKGFDFGLVFVEWIELLETLIRTSITESTKQLRSLRGKVGTAEATASLLKVSTTHDVQPLSLEAFEETVKKGVCFNIELTELKSCIIEFFVAQNVTAEVWLQGLEGSIRRDYLPRLFMNGPRRSEEDATLLDQLNKLSNIQSHISQIYTVLVQDYVCEEKGKIKIELPFEYLIHKCDYLSQLKFHVIARSYLASFLHVVGIYLDKTLWASITHWKIPSDITTRSKLPLEWIQGSVTAAAWEVLRITSINRNRIFSRLEQVFGMWGSLSAESLYLDEKLIEEFSAEKNIPSPEVPNDNMYWFATWLAIPTTTLMDFQMKLAIEMRIFDIAELDYFYWYWDYIYSTRIHASDKIKHHCQSFEANPLFTYGATSFWRGCGQLCRGTFRLIMACKYLRVINDKFSNSSYSSMAVTFANRFKNFQEIINPSALNYFEFVNTVNKDLAVLSPIENKASRCKGALQIVNSANVCFQNAKIMFEDAKGSSPFNQSTIINLIKTSIAAQLQATKLKKFLESRDQNEFGKNEVVAQINFPYSSHFGVLEFQFP